ncbi:AAA family ATPase [Microbacterium sp.]|uniref:AAA family ATPase n=1 Tax=Microbacterium sp. TaxID=51671 RepID=UPI0039E50455
MTIEGLSSTAAAERYVVGALMKDAGCLREVQARVTPSDFEDLRLASIYRGILQMAVERIPIDYIAVADRLAEWDVRGWGIGELAEWEAMVTTTSNVGFYAAKVREAAIGRAVRGVAEELLHGGEVGPAMQKAITDLIEIRDRDAAENASPVRWLRDILSVPEEDDVYDWVIPDVVERRDRLMLTAGEGVGKSMLLRQLALMPAAGLHPFTFSRIEPITALVVDVENSERQWRRAIRRLADNAAQQGVRNPEDHCAVEILGKSDITQPQVLGDIHRKIDAVRPDLVVIGPLYRLAPAINKEEDAAAVLTALDSIRERDVAMLIEAHAGHETSRQGVRNLRPRGSSALLGWPEFGLGLARDKNEDVVGGRATYSLLRWRGDRDHRAFPPKLRRGQVWPWEPTVW